MITSIELHNWKTHKDTTLAFSRGTNILIGQMGAGKSTVTDAISFALFGTYPAIQHRRVSVGDVIMSRPRQMKDAYVRLGFSAEDGAYTVRRALDQNGSSKATLEKDGVYLQSQPERVNENVESILKIDYDLFSRAVYSEQNRLTYFLELTPKERKKQIDELLGLDKFAMAQENSTALVNKIRDMAESETAAAKSLDVARLKEQLAAMQAELEKVRKEIGEGRSGLDKIRAEKAKTGELLSSAKAMFSKKTAAAKAVSELKSRAEVLRKEIEKISAAVSVDKGQVLALISTANAELKALKEDEEKARVEERKAGDAVAVAETESKNLAKQAEEKERIEKALAGRNSKDMKARLEKAQQDLRSLQVENAACAAGRKEAEKWLAELEKHISKCPVCERDLPEEVRNRLLSDKKAAISELSVKAAEGSNKAERLQSEINTLNKETNDAIRNEDRLAELKEVGAKLKDVSERAEKAKAERDRTKALREKRSDEVAKANERISKLNSDRDAIVRKEGYTTEMARCEADVREREKELASMDIDEARMDKLQNEFTNISARESETNARLAAAERSEKEKAAAIKDKEEGIRSVDKLYEGIARKEKVVGELQKYRNALADTQVVLREKLVDYINGTMQAIWPELYPYGDYSSVTLEPDAEDYVLKVRTGGENGKWESVETIASGGERSIACLAMRVAFALVLVPNLKWLILDEPTHNIDRQGLSSFVRVIGEVLPKYVDQVFIITHDETLRQVANARVYMFSRDKAANGETVVEEA